MNDKLDYLALRCLKAILATKEVAQLSRLNLNDIVPGEAREIYLWIQSHVLEFNCFPADVAIVETFGQVLPEEIEPLDYLIGEIKKRSLTFQLTTQLQKVARSLDNNDPEKALVQLTEYLENSKPLEKKPLLSFKQSGLERISGYQAIKQNNIFEGILTPWQELNEAIQGWMNGLLHVALARQNMGKTWLVCISANHCLNHHKKVLLVTLEMPTIRITRRLDAVRYRVNFGRLRNFNLSEEEFITWQTKLRNDNTEGDIIIADKTQVRTVLDTYLLVKKYNPDIVFIDGGYRFEPVSGKSNWEGVVGVLNDLQLYSEKTNIPWVVTSQYGDASESGRNPADKKTPKMHAAGARYAKEWAINPDVVLGLHRSPEDRVLDKLEIHLLKVRDVDIDNMVDSFFIDWNLSSMNFSESAQVANYE